MMDVLKMDGYRAVIQYDPVSTCSDVNLSA